METLIIDNETKEKTNQLNKKLCNQQFRLTKLLHNQQIEEHIAQEEQDYVEQKVDIQTKTITHKLEQLLLHVYW